MTHEPAMGQGEHAMLPLVGAHVWIRSCPERRVVYRMSGPARWPLATKEGGGFEAIYVVDKGAKPGTVRRLSMKELWMAQGRRADEWDALEAQIGAEAPFKDGCAATGRRTALALLGVAAELGAMSVRQRRECAGRLKRSSRWHRFCSG